MFCHRSSYSVGYLWAMVAAALYIVFIPVRYVVAVLYYWKPTVEKGNLVRIVHCEYLTLNISSKCVRDACGGGIRHLHPPYRTQMV